jgi:hypothetical protein
MKKEKRDKKMKSKGKNILVNFNQMITDNFTIFAVAKETEKNPLNKRLKGKKYVKLTFESVYLDDFLNSNSFINPNTNKEDDLVFGYNEKFFYTIDLIKKVMKIIELINWDSSDKFEFFLPVDLYPLIIKVDNLIGFVAPAINKEFKMFYEKVNLK